MPLSSSIAIGTRGSTLAIAQTDMVCEEIRRQYPSLPVHAVRISTAGDRIQDRPLEAIGGKALFVAEIEAALRERRIQLAVHSAKDVPSDLPDDMLIAAYLPRADVRDVLVARDGSRTLATLPAGARVGTGSPRRASQLRAVRPDLVLLDIRGNVGTRLKKLAAGEYDAIVLAAAGLARLRLPFVATEFIPLELMLPCGGQGAIAIEVLAADHDTVELVRSFNDQPTYIAVTAERAFLAAIGGSCTTPLAAYAQVGEDVVSLAAMIGAPDGRSVVGREVGRPADAIAIGTRLANRLLESGGAELLREHALAVGGHSRGTNGN